MMNIYDFDKTIFKKDSTVAFYLFCLRKNPSLLRFLFLQAWYFLLYRLHVVEKKRFKEKFFSFLKGLRDVDEAVLCFWDKNIRHINAWYSALQRSDDVIISASPAFLLRPLCERLHISHLICTEVDEKTGVFYSENCYGAEKLQRFRAQFGDAEIARFYSDSRSDSPLASIAKEAFLVKKGRIIPW
jgi:HAD superfamily phosphoserine phosphatase-like hydrolase